MKIAGSSLGYEKVLVDLVSFCSDVNQRVSSLLRFIKFLLVVIKISEQCFSVIRDFSAKMCASDEDEMRWAAGRPLIADDESQLSSMEKNLRGIIN